MYKRRYHLVLGIVSLMLSITLPTLIRHYYVQMQPWNEAMLLSHSNAVFVVYGFFIMMGLFLLLFTLIALRELGGYMIKILEKIDYSDNDQYST